jgi:hypothetical protein
MCDQILPATKDVNWDAVIKHRLQIRENQRRAGTLNHTTEQPNTKDTAPSQPAVGNSTQVAIPEAPAPKMRVFDNYYLQDIEAVLNEMIPLKFFKEQITGKSVIEIVERYCNQMEGYDNKPTNVPSITAMVSSKSLAGDSIPATRVCYTFEAKYTVENLYQTLYDPEKRIKHDHNLADYRIVRTVCPGVILYYMSLKCPMISNRDFLEASFTVKNADGIYILSTCADSDAVPTEGKTVRAETHIFVSRLRAVNGKPEVTMCSHIDMKISSWQYKLGNGFIGSSSKAFMENVKKFLSENV